MIWYHLLHLSDFSMWFLPVLLFLAALIYTFFHPAEEKSLLHHFIITNIVLVADTNIQCFPESQRFAEKNEKTSKLCLLGLIKKSHWPPTFTEIFISAAVVFSDSTSDLWDFPSSIMTSEVIFWFFATFIYNISGLPYCGVCRQSEPPAALCSQRIGRSTWRYVTSSTRQKKGRFLWRGAFSGKCLTT